MLAINLKVKLSKQEDGLWRAEVPALAGCFVDGATVKDVLRDIQECAVMALDVLIESGDLPPHIALVDIEDKDVEIRIPVVIDEHPFLRVATKKVDSAPASRRYRPPRKAQV